MPSGKKQPARRNRQPESGPFADGAAALAQRLIRVGIDGAAGFDSAAEVARVARREHPDVETAVDAVVRSHLRMVAVGGFVTGVGGFVTLPAALPANVVEFYVIATRMVASVAALRGYDVAGPSMRTAVLLTLVSADTGTVMKRAGVAGTGRLTSLAAARLPAPALVAVNKAVAFRLISDVGGKVFFRLGKAVPLAGGVVGAGLDAYLLSRIAVQARREFPPR